LENAAVLRQNLPANNVGLSVDFLNGFDLIGADQSHLPFHELGFIPEDIFELGILVLPRVHKLGGSGLWPYPQLMDNFGD